MIIDCHAHYEPRILDDESILKVMAEAGVSKTVLIPHLTDPPETQKGDFVMAVQRFMFDSDLLRPLGIAITKSMYKKSGEWNLWLNKLKKEPQKFNIVQKPDNAGIAKMVERFPDQLLGWIFINPLMPEALDELDRWKDTPGMIGVKIHPFWHRFPMEKVEAVARRTEELRLPLLVHLGFGASGNYQWLLEKFPKLKIIIAHLGVPFYKSLWPEVMRNPNVYMDISSTYHVDEGLVRRAVKDVGAHKCLFGTDSPYAHVDAIEQIKKWVLNLPITESDKEKIFSTNFLELAGQ
jgi:uncharacterized protein